MIGNVLIAVDDSPGALAAARLGVEVAKELGAGVRALMVVGDGELRSALEGQGGEQDGELEARRESAAEAVLRHVSGLAQRLGVPVETVKLEGAVASRVLEQARAWPADLVVLGRSREAGVGHPFVGSQARIVLEFADVPVLVVPPPPHDLAPGPEQPERR